LVYEKRVSSIPKLRKELKILDGDAGVRIECVSGGKRLMVFMTRFEDVYTVIVCEAGGKSGKVPGKQVESKEFENVEKSVRFINGLAGPNVTAYIY
jgi:hypothetical protein